MKQLIICLSLTIFISSSAFSQIQVDSIGNVGVGTNTPSAKLDIEGTLQLKDSTEGNNKVLTSDSLGNASWQNISVETIFGSLPLNDPSCLSVTETFTGGGSTTVVSGNYLYKRVPGTGGPALPFTAASVDVFDVTNPASPIFVNNISPSGIQYEFFELSIRDNILSLMGNDIQETFDVSNPLAPITTCTIIYVTQGGEIHHLH